MSHCQLVQGFVSTGNMNTVNSEEYNAIMGPDCCSSSLVLCLGGDVIVVNFSGMGITGDVSSFVFPSTIQRLEMDGNQLTGSLNDFPPSLTHCELFDNDITGLIPPLTSLIEYLYVCLLYTSPSPRD